jgi:deoxyribonuclease V
MIIKPLHEWDVSPAQAIRIQNKLKAKVILEGKPQDIRLVAGVDIGISNDVAKAAVVILKFPQLIPVEQKVITKITKFPYIPGLLAFREIPSILDAFDKIANEPDIILVDGQGIAHPRRFGIASHLGILLDKPTIGCAKKRLFGTYKEPQAKAGSFEYLFDETGTIIGAALRTRDDTNVIYVSVGHKINLDHAIDIVLKCTLGYKLPEPTRLADMVAGGKVIVKEESQRSLF